jgi:CheY-like chemotaxis protein
MTSLHSQRPFVVLMADDDPEDIALFSEALVDDNTTAVFRSVSDGFELIQYLHCRGDYSGHGQTSPTPDLILLDLNMPKKNGTEVLAELKSTPHLRNIPIFILSTSDAERDHARTTLLGADRYYTKPSSYIAFSKLVESLKTYCTSTIGQFHG